MKENYTEANIEVIKFESADVITESDPVMPPV